MTMPVAEIPPSDYAYTAQTYEGRPVTGTIQAPTADAAAQLLSDLKLRVLQLNPVSRSFRRRPLRGEDFTMFNQQLAHLVGASLPVEQGLRLIAEDLRHGGLAESIRAVASEMEAGAPLGEAFARHKTLFPPLYGTLVEVGVRCGDLAGVLLNLGRHLELVSRLREAIWRAAAYPLAVVAGLLAVMIFLGHYVIPQMQELYRGWYMQLPAITLLLFGFARLTPWLIALALVLFLGLPVLWNLLRPLRLHRHVLDLLLYMPLIGPVLKRNLIARWCDAMDLTVQGGVDLPQALRLSAQVVDSPALRADCDRIVAQLEAGNEINRIQERLRVIPPTILAIAQLSADRNDLPHALQSLSRMYEQQAELRLATVQTLLGPMLLVLVAIFIAFAVVGMFAPLISMIRSIGC